ncbi:MULTISPECIES: DUF1622 domain-containing protein [unclassified Rhizobium]|uniref:DUF1622 domain-containing protein n=1 Tax=unclassified Rhizobium TaxID=2613769 RepID=UPI001AD9566D|nr:MULTISPECIES: DUF1622 domain-containing protein [unclassified Rhizobium]MBO9126766.1 DUF1622 domain-containing protein [Rhizobium sp. 16-488-2b]MBO9177213.1 DUF1622 domain-containing protein [Rhizobium sp. 16-488-2a]
MDNVGEVGGLASLIAPILKPMASGLEFFGVGVILIGVVVATVSYVRDLMSSAKHDAYDRYRANLGRGILLGLEILIGADIIATIISPLTWESVGLLGLIVMIRTFLSFSLEAEIDGQWPWSRASKSSAESR